MRSGALAIGLVTAGVAANAIRLRRRLTRLAELPQPIEEASSPASYGAVPPGEVNSGSPGTSASQASPGSEASAPTASVPPAQPAEDYGLITAEGVGVSDDVRQSAIAYAEQHGLGVLDLVPADLPVEQALDLARYLDLDAFRGSPLAQGRGAGHAILVGAELLKRSETQTKAGLHPGEMAEATLRLRQYASAADLVIAPVKARTPSEGLAGRRAWLTALSVQMRQSYAVPMTVTGSALGYGTVLGCLAINPVLGLVPLAVYSATPYIVFGGTAIRPRDLHRAALLRLVDTPLTWLRTVRAPHDRWERRRAKELAASRSWHDAQLAEGQHRFFEPLRETCPWCESKALRRYLRLRDGVHMKPGHFTLDRCEDCGHVFLNPGLSLAGLDFYYRDVYDGLGGPDMENVLSGQRETYLGRAQLVRDALVQGNSPTQSPAQVRGEASTQATAHVRIETPAQTTALVQDDAPGHGAALVQDDAPTQGTASVQDDAPSHDAALLPDDAPRHDAALVQDTAPVRDDALTQDAAPVRDDALTQDAAPVRDGALAQDAALVRGKGAEPKTWLDVGTGSAHFPRMAQEVFPDTEFHGLDMGSAVLDAARRGWIERAYRGLFPELADELAGQYDVISMNHYLEHTLDPKAELDAVAKALRPGGHLLIEVPDPESRFGRLLRSYWIAWLPPEHLNLVTIGNLEQALEERGFEVVGRVRRAARQGPDVPHGAAAFLNTLWHPLDRPWTIRRPLMVTALRRTAVVAGAVPIMLGSIAAELAVQPFMGDRSNAYRVVARKRAG